MQLVLIIENEMGSKVDYGTVVTSLFQDARYMEWTDIIKVFFFQCRSATKEVKKSVVCNFLQLYMVLDYMLLFSIHPFSLRA
jgi:hypothetical protein